MNKAELTDFISGLSFHQGISGEELVARRKHYMLAQWLKGGHWVPLFTSWVTWSSYIISVPLFTERPTISINMKAEDTSWKR